MKTTATTLQTLIIYTKENLRYKWLFFSMIFSWVAGIMIQKLILPLIVVKAFDVIIKTQSSDTLSWNSFVFPLIFFIIAALTSQAFIDIGLVLLTKLETKVLPQLHLQVYNTLVHQTIGFHNNNFSGALVNQTNRFVNGYVAVTDVFVMNITQLIVLVFMSSAILIYYSPLLGLTLLIWAIFFLSINVFLTRRRVPLSKARAAADSRVTGYLADSISNLSAIKTFAAEKYELANYKKVVTDRAHKGYLYWMRSIRNDAVFGLSMSFLQVLILGVSIFALQRGAITAGTLILAQVYITQVIAYLWGFSSITKSLEQNLSDASEMTHILQLETKIKDVSAAPQLDIDKARVEFKNVTFTHAESTDQLFDKLNLVIKPGEKIGLVGASGGGKSSITKLLLRFVDIQGGEIMIDGQNISQVTQQSLRESIAYVPQEPILFHRTLEENIGYGSPTVKPSAIQKAAKKAHAHEFVKELPNGYQTLVGERGVKLSGGQRQRIAIARAILKDAPILVLDEATSALDSESEVLIQDALWKLMEGRTAMVIAHRLSTIQKMDRIVVLDKGQIIEQGTHQELLNAKGTYAKLWAHQSGGFLED